ncbi:hypothetical protein H4582DRAFT_732941 [Lactarius indigo]|nr:hypothetical protein H4582DRAFT_732941 [Lactarius indigo]
MFIRDFERICRGETSLEQAGLVLGIPQKDTCHYLGFEHGRVCVATVQGLYFFTFGTDLSARAVSRTAAYILLGKIQGAGRTLRCLKMRKTLRSFHGPQHQCSIYSSN